MGSHCAGPKRQHYVQEADPTIRTASGRDSVLLERIASYRAPLPPHLARHLLSILNLQYKNQFKNIHLFYFHRKLLTLYFKHDKLLIVATEEYPSLAEGIGLENRQGC